MEGEGEATSEKMAFAHTFDGRVSAVVGTHTHIPTADEQILPQGKWPDEEFDWLIQLRYDENGHLLNSQRINENLTPGAPAKPPPPAP